MYVECPHCHAIFALPAGLEEAPERVRCGECNTIFTPQADNHVEENNSSSAQASSEPPLSIDDFLTDGASRTTATGDELDNDEPDNSVISNNETEGPIDDDIMESFQSYLDEDSYPKELEKELPDLNAGAIISPVENDPLAEHQEASDDNEVEPADGILEINQAVELLDDESSDLVSDRLEESVDEDNSPKADIADNDEQAEYALPDINNELIESPEEIPEVTETTQQENIWTDSKSEKVSDLATDDDSENIAEEDKQTLTGEFSAFIDDVDSDPIDLFSADRAESIYEQQFLTLDDEPAAQQADLLDDDDATEQADDKNSPIAELNQLIDESDANPLDSTPDTSLPAIAENEKKPLSAYLNSTWFYTLAGLFLLLTLTLQYLHSHHDQFAAYPETRPLIETLCKITGCSISPQRDLSAIELLNHGIYAHPTAENALIIKALIRNQSDFPQPYPSIELTLADLNDRKIALRRFGPGEYLNEKPSEDGLMPVNKNIPVHLQVLDPGQEAVAFEFEFL